MYKKIQFPISPLLLELKCDIGTTQKYIMKCRRALKCQMCLCYCDKQMQFSPFVICISNSIERHSFFVPKVSPLKCKAVLSRFSAFVSKFLSHVFLAKRFKGHFCVCFVYSILTWCQLNEYPVLPTLSIPGIIYSPRSEMPF